MKHNFIQVKDQKLQIWNSGMESYDLVQLMASSLNTMSLQMLAKIPSVFLSMVMRLT